MAKPFRLLSEVVSAALLPDPRCFRISFRDGVREYEAETKLEAGQIVNKIKFLLKSVKK